MPLPWIPILTAMIMPLLGPKRIKTVARNTALCCFVQVISLQYLREQLVEDILLWNQEIYCIEYSFEFLGYLI